MSPLRRQITFISIVVLSLFVAGSALGAGYSLFEQGAKATAMGGAFAATADDPSAIFYNVAGIAFQRKTAAMMGGTWITFNAEFQGDPLGEYPGADPSSPIPGVGIKEFYADHNFILPNTYVVIPIGKNATFGIGQFTPFGLRTDWVNKNTTFTGRFISQDALVKTVAIEPAFAMKTSNGRFAWGVGVQVMGGNIALSRNNAAVNPFTSRIADIAHVQLKSDDQTSVGWNAGIIWVPTDTWRIGLSYRSSQNMDFGGTVDVTQIMTGYPQFDGLVATQLPPSQDAKVKFPYPGLGIFGIATTAIPNWTIEADVAYMNWSKFKTLDINFVQTPEFSLSRTEGWKDVYSYRLGANRRVNDNWDVRLGTLYDQNPQPTKAVSPLLPDADRIGACLGVGYRNGPWSIDVTEFFLQFKARDTNRTSQDGYDGTYKTQANLVSLDFGYTF